MGEERRIGDSLNPRENPNPKDEVAGGNDSDQRWGAASGHSWGEAHPRRQEGNLDILSVSEGTPLKRGEGIGFPPVGGGAALGSAR